MGTSPFYSSEYFHGQFYHVFSRTNNLELLFKSDENRRFFLSKLHDYLHPFIEIHAYCLMDTHFHMLIKIKSHDEIQIYFDTKPSSQYIKSEKNYILTSNVDELIDGAIHRFMTSYSKAFNKYHRRHGHLFENPYHRIQIANELHLQRTIDYIHKNPVKHGVCENYLTYRWSSAVEGNRWW